MNPNASTQAPIKEDGRKMNDGGWGGARKAGGRDRVYEVLAQLPEGMEFTPEWLAQQSEQRPTTVSTWVARLHESGAIRRVSRGVYQVVTDEVNVITTHPTTAKGSPVAQPLQQAVNSLVPAILAVPSRGKKAQPKPQPEARPESLETPVVVPAPAPAPAPVPVVPSAAEVAEIAGTALESPLAGKDADDVIDQLLDRLFPSGFKARHLKVIDRWRNATHALIEEIEG